MPIPMEAIPGEMVYALIKRAQKYLKEGNHNDIEIIHNGTRVVVHSQSYIDDLCEKFDLRRRVDQLEREYRR